MRYASSSVIRTRASPVSGRSREMTVVLDINLLRSLCLCGAVYSTTETQRNRCALLLLRCSLLSLLTLLTHNRSSGSAGHIYLLSLFRADHFDSFSPDDMVERQRY